MLRQELEEWMMGGVREHSPKEQRAEPEPEECCSQPRGQFFHVCMHACMYVFSHFFCLSIGPAGLSFRAPYPACRELPRTGPQGGAALPRSR